MSGVFAPVKSDPISVVRLNFLIGALMRRSNERFSSRTFVAMSLLMLASVACDTDSTAPRLSPHDLSATNRWGPETPTFNVEAVLRLPTGGGARGHVKFRQPNDDQLRIELGVDVRDLVPNTHYQLQRAVDTPDGICTSTSWLTLGKGLVPQDIVTDDKGDATQDLFRILTSPIGTEFDIRFRVVAANTTTVVLVSDCYHFTVSQ
jgi:hypothetical protein